MPWIFFAVINIFSMAIANLFSRVLMKDDKSDTISYAIVFQVLCAILTGIFALWKGFVLPPFQTHYVNFILSGILYGLGSVCMFQAVKYLEASEAAIIAATGTVVTIIASVIFLHEGFSLQKIFGTVLILSSVSIISRNKKLIMNKGMLFAVASTVLMGLGVTNDAYILKSYDAISYTPIAFFIPAIVIFILQPKSVTKFHTVLSGKTFWNMLLLVFFYSLQAIGYYVAMERGAGASQMAPISRATIIVTVILAALFLRERDHLITKFASAILVTAGVLLLR
jgi:drug/metabolite transporter (DMT)-like permease